MSKIPEQMQRARNAWLQPGHPRPPASQIEVPRPGQESVWDYPRPPRVEPVHERVRIEFGGVLIADTRSALRLLETSHPPSYYLPAQAVRDEFVRAEPGSSLCEWKGHAEYWTVVVNERVASRAAWSYPDPFEDFAELRDHLCFYCAPMDACWVGDARAQPQPGGFYGGWITPKVVGPFKGGPGSGGW